MKPARLFRFSLFDSRCAGGATDPRMRSPFMIEADHYDPAPSGAFLASSKSIPWDDPELCALVDAINQQFGQLGDTSIQETRQDADSLEKILDQP